MKLGIVGGLLQGMEAVYLAKKAGYETLVIDRNEKAPAVSIADGAETVDITLERSKAERILSDCDAIMPANENIETLVSIDKIAREIDVDLLFDLNAYNISSSKILSNKLMNDLDIPMPKPWPECGFPVIVKPSSQSGSIGVRKAYSTEDVNSAVDAIHKMGDEEVIQEFADGPNISIEVIGDGTSAKSMILTEVVLDDRYDCKMVRCPMQNMDQDVLDAFSRCGESIAEALSLKGIMDVEAIYSKKGLKVLEIDARIPSQTPAAIVNATGVNLIKHLVEAVKGNLSGPQPADGSAIYEHLIFKNGILRSCGEKVFAGVENPRIEYGLFGSSEMITDYEPGKDLWYATVITKGKTPEDTWNKRQKCIECILKENNIKQYSDPEPEMITLPA